MRPTPGSWVKKGLPDLLMAAKIATELGTTPDVVRRRVRPAAVIHTPDGSFPVFDNAGRDFLKRTLEQGRGRD